MKNLLVFSLMFIALSGCTSNNIEVTKNKVIDTGDIIGGLDRYMQVPQGVLDTKTNIIYNASGQPIK